MLISALRAAAPPTRVCLVFAAWIACAAWHGEPARAAEPDADAPWQKLFADEPWYKSEAGAEMVFRGKLEAVANADGPSTLQRAAYYKLGGRTIYTGAKKLPALDKLVGRPVEMRGKAVGFALEGQDVREIWPAAVRPGKAVGPEK